MSKLPRRNEVKVRQGMVERGQAVASSATRSLGVEFQRSTGHRTVTTHNQPLRTIVSHDDNLMRLWSEAIAARIGRLCSNHRCSSIRIWRDSTCRHDNDVVSSRGAGTLFCCSLLLVALAS